MPFIWGAAFAEATAMYARLPEACTCRLKADGGNPTINGWIMFAMADRTYRYKIPLHSNTWRSPRHGAGSSKRPHRPHLINSLVVFPCEHVAVHSSPYLQAEFRPPHGFTSSSPHDFSMVQKFPQALRSLLGKKLLGRNSTPDTRTGCDLSRKRVSRQHQRRG